MTIGQKQIEFLGAIIGNGEIRLQPNIIKKIVEKQETDLTTKSGLRSWLGILNYARNFIPNLGKLLAPLYGKTSPTGEKKFNQQDWALVRQVKEHVQNLPALTIPPTKCFIVLETDGCMEGWGGICKWKLQKYDPRSMEKPCAYASRKFSPPKSTIDAEIFAVMDSLESLKSYYLEQEEILIRTDCQAIISFFNKSNINKPSRVRWVAFVDFITGLGIDVSFEHINGRDNVLVDSLSRLITLLVDSPPNHPEPQLLTAFELCLQEWQDHPGLPSQQEKFHYLCNQMAQEGHIPESEFDGPILGL
ncbi:Polyprotein P3 [Nymphaea thermarum]|nr:Polyprotein P3 [Nymphaea thermarum]